MKASELDLRTIHKVKISNMTGYPLISQHEKDAEIDSMQELKKQAGDEIRTAIAQSSTSGNLEALWHVLFKFAWNESVLAYPHYTINNFDEVNYALRIARSVFERLFTIAPILGQMFVVKTFFGYSRILLFFGKFGEALAYLDQGQAIAEKLE